MQGGDLTQASFLLIPVSVNEHSFCTSLRHAIQQHQLLSNPWFGAFEAYSQMCLLLRSVFSQTTVWVRFPKTEAIPQISLTHNSVVRILNTVCGVAVPRTDTSKTWRWFECPYPASDISSFVCLRLFYVVCNVHSYEEFTRLAETRLDSKQLKLPDNNLNCILSYTIL